jgi:putative SOS response-associated peptidase YedK
VGKKTSIPYRFVASSNELFSFAGLWEEFEDTDGHEIQTFKLITTTSNKLVELFAERMPLILNKESEALWLDQEADETTAMKLLQTENTLGINNYPVTPGIANTAQDLASMILPTPPADQHGNLTLFD